MILGTLAVGGTTAAGHDQSKVSGTPSLECTLYECCYELTELSWICH